MPPIRFAAFVHLLMNADPQTGIAWSSARTLAERYDYNERTARDCLETLEAQNYIKRFPIRGKHGQYPILIAKYVCSVGVNEGKSANASATTDYRQPVYDSRDDAGLLSTCDESVHDGRHDRKRLNTSKAKVSEITSRGSRDEFRDESVQVSAPYREIRIENTTPLVEPAAGSTTDLFDLQKPAGKPTERDFLEAGRQVYLYFCEKLQHNPIVYTWTPKRRQMMRQRAREAYGMAVGHYPGLTPAEWLERTTEAMRVAVNNFALSDFHQGRDPKTGGKKFVGIEYCFGSPERMQRWLMGG